MNCVLIETDQGRYCDSHRTWHADGALASFVEYGDVLPHQWEFLKVRHHTCTIGNSETCAACIGAPLND